MSNEIKSIHEFDVNLICEYYAHFERQGPGSPQITMKALSFIEGLSRKSKIADLGCGTGGQTMVLGQNTEAQIIGLDVFQTFIDLFNKNAEKSNLQNRVKGQLESMDQLPFQPNELDLIWSEGAIYNIGFERGLKEWRKYIKPEGYLAVSEASWFTEKRPKEIDEFWQDAYPEIGLVSEKVSQMEKAGYVPVASFILPDYCWTEQFFEPQVPVQETFLNKHKNNSAVAGFIANQKHEAVLYDKYKAYYGYVFYIGRKMD